MGALQSTNSSPSYSHNHWRVLNNHKGGSHFKEYFIRNSRGLAQRSATSFFGISLSLSLSYPSISAILRDSSIISFLAPFVVKSLAGGALNFPGR